MFSKTPDSLDRSYQEPASTVRRHEQFANIIYHEVKDKIKYYYIVTPYILTNNIIINGLTKHFLVSKFK